MGKSRNNFSLTGIIMLLFCAPTLGQNSEFHPSIKPINKYIVDQWTTDDGLMSNNIRNVCQALDGFIYVTSFNGLHKFDGVNFKLYDKDNLPFLKTNAFYKYFQEPDGKMWFTTQGSGVILYDGDTFKEFEPDSIPSRSVRAITRSGNGDYWIGTNDKGVFRYSNGEFIHLEDKNLESVNIMAIAEDLNGSIWIGTDGKGLFKYKDDNLERFTRENGLPDDTIITIKKDKSGYLWVGTQQGVCQITPDKITHFEKLKRFAVNDIEFEKGWIWMATEQGLVRYKESDESLEVFNEKEGLMANQVSSICFDSEGSLWLSTKKAGLIRLKDTNFIQLTKTDGLSSDKVNIIEKFGDKYFVGTDDGVVNVVDKGIITQLPIKIDLNELGIRDIIYDQNKNYWIATYKGLLKVDRNGKETLYTMDDGLPSNEIRRILYHDGKILIGTTNGGFAIFKDGKTERVYDKFSGLVSNYIFDLDVLSTGEIALCTSGGGLSFIEPDGSVKNLGIKGNSGIAIFNLHEDETSGNYWIVTNVGVYFLQQGELKKVNFDENLKLDTFFDLHEDSFQNLWLTSNLGVIECKEEDVFRNLNGELDFVPVRIFDGSDGMPNKECTGATRFYMGNNEIWIPTISGVAIADVTAIRSNTVVPKVAITDFITDDSPVKLSQQKIQIIPGFSRYTISFTSLSFQAPERIQFKYMLEGFDEDWITDNTTRQVEYTNLSPKIYTFHVMATNNDGVWNPEEAAITFEVLPFFYQTKMFLIMGIVALLGLVWLFFKMRVKNIQKVNYELRKLNNELDKFVYSASHDLRAPLTSVMGLVEVARMDKDVGQKDKYLELIKTSVNKLDGFIKDIIDFSKNERMEFRFEKVNIEEEIMESLDSLKYLEKSERIKKVINNNSGNGLITDRSRLKIILKNLISNAINYSDLYKPEPFINIEIGQDKQFTTIKIEDNGIGIQDDQKKHIFDMFYRADETSQGSGLGLYIVKEALEKLKGTVEVYSYPGEGTRFIIRIPNKYR